MSLTAAANSLHVPLARGLLEMCDSSSHIPSSSPTARSFDSALRNNAHTAPSLLTERQDGSSRIIQKSYWSQGLCRGIYYLFQYWFVLDKPSRKMMDSIYSEIRNAIEEDSQIDIQRLASFIMSQSSSAVIQGVIEKHFNMIQHAFGYTGQAEELLLNLHERRRELSNSFFLDCLVKRIVGEKVFISENNTLALSCYEYLDGCVVKVKNHPLYRHMQLVLGEDPVCAEVIATRAFAIIKDLSEVSQLNRGLALYLVRDVEDRKILAQILKDFKRFDIENTQTLAHFVKTNRLNIQRLVGRNATQAAECIGKNNFDKLKAMLQLIELPNDQPLAIIQQIIENFSGPNAHFSERQVTAFFSSLESSIQDGEMGALIDESPTQLLGKACLNGFDLIGCYFESVQRHFLSDEMARLGLLGWLSSRAMVDKSPPWGASQIAQQVAPLVARFKADLLISVIQKHVVDFNRICGEANIQTLLKSLFD